MPLKRMILDTPLEAPARSIMHLVHWPTRKSKPVMHWFKQKSRYIRIALASRNNRDVGDIDVVICSPGGVATTMLLEHVACFLRTNAQNDADTLKHVPRPELILSDPKFQGQMIYVYGEVDSIVASIERRCFVRIQGAKLGSMSAVLFPKSASRNAFAKAVSDQIETFLSCKDQRLMTMRFEDLWESSERLADFLAIENPQFLEDFPQRKRRQTEQTD